MTDATASERQRQGKLDQLAKGEGMTADELLEVAATAGVAAGICIVPSCNYVTVVISDEDRGWCENCRANTVWGPLYLAGLI